jgi:hypothetical protein
MEPDELLEAEYESRNGADVDLEATDDEEDDDEPYMDDAERLAMEQEAMVDYLGDRAYDRLKEESE